MELRRSNHTTANRRCQPPAACQRLCLLLPHRSIASIAVRHGRKAAVRLGRKVTSAFGPQPSLFAVRYGCKVVARSRVQIDKQPLYAIITVIQHPKPAAKSAGRGAIVTPT